MYAVVVVAGVVAGFTKHASMFAALLWAQPLPLVAPLIVLT
jgi:hypothetical protein